MHIQRMFCTFQYISIYHFRYLILFIFIFIDLIFTMAAAAQPAPFNDIMDNEPSFGTILNSFGLTGRASNRFTEDFETARQLMLATEDQVTQVISNQNKLYRNHTQANQRCYINATQTTRIQTFRKWSIIAVKEGGAMYDVGDVGKFTADWVDEILDEFNQTKTTATTPGALSVKVPKFNGNNWYEVKSDMAKQESH